MSAEKYWWSPSSRSTATPRRGSDRASSMRQDRRKRFRFTSAFSPPSDKKAWGSKVANSARRWMSSSSTTDPSLSGSNDERQSRAGVGIATTTPAPQSHRHHPRGEAVKYRRDDASERGAASARRASRPRESDGDCLPRSGPGHHWRRYRRRHKSESTRQATRRSRGDTHAQPVKRSPPYGNYRGCRGAGEQAALLARGRE